jgi:hypothetical protein
MGNKADDPKTADKAEDTENKDAGQETKEADVTKMYDEPMWIPPGITSFEELDAYMESREMEADVRKATEYFRDLASNIMMSDMVEDKPGALANLAGEFINRMGVARGDLKEIDESDDKEVDDRDDVLKAVWSTAFVNNLPDSSFLYVESGCGEKDSENKTKPRTCRHLPYKDASGKVDLPHIRNAIARIPQMKGISADKKASLQAKARRILENTQKEVEQETIIDRAIAKTKEIFGLKEKSQPQLEKNTFSHIWKEVDGQYHWLGAYTNNYRDNDNPPEIISSDAHKEFDQAVNSGEWPMPEVWLWHYPYPVGKTHYHAYDEKSGFCIAGGTFDKDKGWAAEGVIKANWRGMSHGMPRKEVRREDDKDKSIITRRRSREITFLPTKAAANSLAFHLISKESNGMNDVKEIPAHKREEFIAAFGEERVKQMEDELAQRAKQASDAGTESKEKTPPVEQAKEQPAPAQAEQPSADMVEAVRALTTSIRAIGESVQVIDSRLKELEKTDKERLEKQAASIPEASLASFVKSELFTKQNQVTGEVPGPEQNKAKQDGSTGLWWNELGWTQAGWRQ